jgi:hypothetical protein
MYRRGGDFERVLRFMRELKSLRADIELTWKYILFEFNDSETETNTAQDIAEELGIDRVLFVMTNSRGRSKRYTASTLRELPLHSPRASASPAAALQRVQATGP